MSNDDDLNIEDEDYEDEWDDGYEDDKDEE